jgi:hypothetical protein
LDTFTEYNKEEMRNVDREPTFVVVPAHPGWSAPEAWQNEKGELWGRCTTVIAWAVDTSTDDLGVVTILSTGSDDHNPSYPHERTRSCSAEEQLLVDKDKYVRSMCTHLRTHLDFVSWRWTQDEVKP